MNDIYDCPIEQQIGQLSVMMANEHDRQIIKAVQQVGIEIDQKGLVEAINNDRRRYEEAYTKGYNKGVEEHSDDYGKGYNAACAEHKLDWYKRDGQKYVHVGTVAELRRYLADIPGDAKIANLRLCPETPVQLTMYDDDPNKVWFG